MFEGLKSIHFVGIGGIGTSALAKFFVHRGLRVSGSDLQVSDTTEECRRMGMKIFSGHAVGNVGEGVECVIYSPAVLETNPEREEAKRCGIPQMSYPEALGELSKEYSTIAVCGTNGKSTTTAMLGRILVEAGYDPTVIVGTKVPDFPDGNLRMGKGRFFLLEACEYREHFLHLHPEMIVLTNIEADHLDYFRDLAHICATFQAFANKLAGKGMLVWNGGDPTSRELRKGTAVSYGYGTDADYAGFDRKAESGRQRFSLRRSTPEEELGSISLSVPGLFNVQNALAAAVAAMELGVPVETVRHALETFPGVWRRFERVGTWHEAKVISDYGHHPTAIAQTLAGAREFFPGRRIILCFQPHQHARTKALFDRFVDAIAQADVSVVLEIYAVAGRTESDDVSSKDLVRAIHSRFLSAASHYTPDLDHAESVLRDLVRPGDVLIVQGAGDVDTLARRLV
ncbi:UDP-N-acetylmuramate--L-alanine ligase [Candidatus Uhrbacteria bacterium]|nr:UDP-N-acetylmuramate--L-alanine ligase [Candidatus Uhrbacteria bacterium]MBI4598934.1 UDP-N-acetylmuramate--L-alanine ligase [Candidatus Uhrbacteria bacterium]